MAAQSKPGDIGSELIQFELPSIEGNVVSTSELDDKKILVVIFMCNHCPYVKAVADRLVSIQKSFGGKGVQLVGINPNDSVAYPEDSFENMKLFAAQYNLNFPYLRDESQDTARAYEAVCTPDIYVYDHERRLRYRGRIDDNWKDETAVTSRDLENALTCLVEEREIDFEQKHSIGCSIKWKG